MNRTQLNTMPSSTDHIQPSRATASSDNELERQRRMAREPIAPEEMEAVVPSKASRARPSPASRRKVAPAVVTTGRAQVTLDLDSQSHSQARHGILSGPPRSSQRSDQRAGALHVAEVLQEVLDRMDSAQAALSSRCSTQTA